MYIYLDSGFHCFSYPWNRPHSCSLSWNSGRLKTVDNNKEQTNNVFTTKTNKNRDYSLPFLMYFLLKALIKEDFPVFGKPQIRIL